MVNHGGRQSTPGSTGTKSPITNGQNNIANGFLIMKSLNAKEGEEATEESTATKKRNTNAWSVTVKKESPAAVRFGRFWYSFSSVQGMKILTRISTK